MISCGDNFLPPVWFMCMTSVNHLLLVLNTIANFMVYCVFNEGFKKVILKLMGRKVAASRNASQQGQTVAGERANPELVNGHATVVAAAAGSGDLARHGE